MSSQMIAAIWSMVRVHLKMVNISTEGSGNSVIALKGMESEEITIEYEVCRILRAPPQSFPILSKLSLQQLNKMLNERQNTTWKNIGITNKWIQSLVESRMEDTEEKRVYESP